MDLCSPPPLQTVWCSSNSTFGNCRVTSLKSSRWECSRIIHTKNWNGKIISLNFECNCQCRDLLKSVGFSSHRTLELWILFLKYCECVWTSFWQISELLRKKVTVKNRLKICTDCEMLLVSTTVCFMLCKSAHRTWMQLSDAAVARRHAVNMCVFYWRKGTIDELNANKFSTWNTTKSFT